MTPYELDAARLRIQELHRDADRQRLAACVVRARRVRRSTGRPKVIAPALRRLARSIVYATTGGTLGFSGHRK